MIRNYHRLTALLLCCILLVSAGCAAAEKTITITFTEKAKAYSTYTKQKSPEYHYDSGTKFIYQLILYYSSKSKYGASLVAQQQRILLQCRRGRRRRLDP